MKRFSKYNGAVQAKWNRRNSNILASAHEGMIFIWDIRKEGQPIASITAHNTQIYGIDWSYLSTNEIISCSQDKMVKLWSIDNPRECKMVLQTGTPVLRAKYLPFSTGIVTVAERGNYILRLWSIKDPSTPPTVPIHAFVGHSDGIRSFDWRISRPKEDIQRLDAIQMLSWSKDQSLRFWCFDNSHLAACGIYASPQPSHRRGSVYFFGDLPPDSPTVPNRYPHLAYGGMNSPNFDANAKYIGLATGEKITSTSTLSTPVAGASGVTHATHAASMYMGDSLGEGYFGGGMEDLLGGGHSDEGEEFRKSLAHLQKAAFGADVEGREERNTDADRAELRGDQDMELRGTDEKIVDDSCKIDLGLTMLMNNRRSIDETRSFPTPEDQGLIPGDLEHEFLLLKKKKFAGINIVQANANQRTMIIHIDDGDPQNDRKFQLKITFPSLYPHNASPSFVISDIDPSAMTNTPTRTTPTKQQFFTTTTNTTTTSTAVLATTPPNISTLSLAKQVASPLSPAATRANSKFLENLKRVAELRVSHNMPCIESCLVKLVAMLREDERMSQVNTQIRQRNTSPTTSPLPPAPEESKDTLQTLGLPVPDPSARTPALPLLPQHASPTATALEVPGARMSLPAPTPIISPSTISREVVPQIQVFAAETNLGKQTNQLPNFDYRVSGSDLAAFVARDTIENSMENNPLDPSSNMIRSKSTVELRNTAGNTNMGTLETIPASPIPSPRPATPMPTATDSTSTNCANSNAPNAESASATGNQIRRSRSAGYNRLSGRYIESVAMHIPSPRMCSVAISPTGKLVYFQTIHCKNMALPSPASPQVATSPSGEPSITLSASSEASAGSVEPSQSNAVGNTSSTAHSPSSDKVARRTPRTPRAADMTNTTTHSTTESADPPSLANTDGAEGIAETKVEPGTKQNPKDSKSPEDSLKLKDKLKHKIKDLLKDKLKYKIGKPKTKPDELNEKEASENFIGEFNLATFKIRHRDEGSRDQTDAEDGTRNSRSGNGDMYNEDCSEEYYSSGDSEAGESTDEEDEDRDGETNSQTRKTNTSHNPINSILNKDTKPGNNLTLPFFGVFPRTYPELTSIVQSSKVAHQFTTNNTVILAQLKSLNSLRISTKMYITDISHLLPINVHLAAHYSLLGNVLDVCDHNQAAARKMHRLDLVKVWRTLYVLCNPIVYNQSLNSSSSFVGGGIPGIALFRDPWVALPIARNLVSAMFKHYEAIGDLQTLAMMSSVLLQSKLMIRSARSAVKHVSVEEENEISLLDPAKEPSAHAYRHAYGEILNKWGLLVKRAELLKHTYHPHPRNHTYSPGTGHTYFPPSHRGVTFSVICSSCDQGLKDNFFCSSCKTYGFKCAICNLSVKGLSNFCILCGHGGHAHHTPIDFQKLNFFSVVFKNERIFHEESTAYTSL
eukprot:Phypoly_transcript_00310.p1 GENE.Phypoly_transcript_00310~~Phypoly_transcript_00310.p1  ORF type:complete len:1416 (+),score=192.66 Phypoly_transcript_00310:632-4879(+)